MNTVVTQEFDQPEFADNVAKSVWEELDTEFKDREYADSLQVDRPDYTKPLGLRNLYRTTLRCEFPAESPNAKRGVNLLRVHVSNILYGQKQDTIAVVYERFAEHDPEGKLVSPARSVTRHYTDVESIPEVSVTYYHNGALTRHISNFLTKGEWPR